MQCDIFECYQLFETVLDMSEKQVDTAFDRLKGQ